MQLGQDYSNLEVPEAVTRKFSTGSTNLNRGVQHVFMLWHGADHDASEESTKLVRQAELAAYPCTRKAVANHTHLKELIRIVAPYVCDYCWH